jgi:hypothetical protein
MEPTSNHIPIRFVCNAAAIPLAAGQLLLVWPQLSRPHCGDLSHCRHRLAITNATGSLH